MQIAGQGDGTAEADTAIAIPPERGAPAEDAGAPPGARARSGIRVVALALLAQLIVAGVAVALIVTFRPSPQEGAAGLGDPVYPTLGNGGYDVQRYTLDFDIREPGGPFKATAMLEAQATQPLSRFSLDLAGNEVEGVTVDGQEADYDRQGAKLVISPARRLERGRPFQVVVRYTAEPACRKGEDHGWLCQGGGFVLAGQPDGAHRVFPSNDHPSDKAYFTVRLTVPEGTTAVAGGTLVAESRDGGRTTVTYTSRDPMATELVQIAVGPYTLVRGTGPHGLPLRHVVPSDRVEGFRPVLDRTAEQISWLEQRLGAYPFETYGLLIAPRFAYDGLETQTLSLFDATYLADKASRAEPLMVHELAHQWFGNSVTPRTWADLWLNEGHATWYEWRYAAEHGWLSSGDRTGADPGSTDPQAAFEQRMRKAYAAGDRWRKHYGPVGRPTAEDLFSRNVYDGGALVLYALHEKVGEQTFDRIERAWVSEHRGGVADTPAFIAVASRVAGRDLTAFLTDWIYGTTTPPMPGHPDWTP